MEKPYCMSYHSWERFGGSATSHRVGFPRGFSLGPDPWPPWVQTEAQGSGSAFPGWARSLAFTVTTVSTMQMGVLVHGMLAFSPCGQIFIHSFNKHLLSTYYVPGTALGPRDTAVNETKPLFLIIFGKLMF